MRWVFKVIAKLLIARLPVSYAFWKSIGVFRHGRMDSMDYPIKIFNMHLSRAFPLGLPAGSVILELGPGDSVASAVLGFVNGAHCTYLVDVGDFARKDAAFYHQLAIEMTGRGSCAPEFSTATSFEEILQICNAQYLIEGISSLHQIPSGSVDFIWSHSVLEHVRKHELRTLLCELRRILKPGAFSSHNIDYQDHLHFLLNPVSIPTVFLQSKCMQCSRKRVLKFCKRHSVSGRCYQFLVSRYIMNSKHFGTMN